jgi:hypothetical protein
MSKIGITTSIPLLMPALAAPMPAAASAAASGDDSGVSGKPEFRVTSKTVTNRIDTKILEGNLKKFLDDFEPALNSLTSQRGNFSVNEIEINLAITSKGGINLIGQLSIGIESSIKLKLSRNK